VTMTEPEQVTTEDDRDNQAADDTAEQPADK
jgi:hypothetical protein